MYNETIHAKKKKKSKEKNNNNESNIVLFHNDFNV